MKSLVGYTGFVGSNLVAKGQFDNLYNSVNIEEAFGTRPELLVFAGIRAEKYLANHEPEKDYELIKEAYENIVRISPQKLVLISTIDVYKTPDDVSEDFPIETKELHPYGLNRYLFEQMIDDSGLDYTIIRLPGLYGKNLKKNFIYDLINIIPSVLIEQKLNELCNIDDFAKSYYINQMNGFYKLKSITDSERVKLKKFFNSAGFSALNFTDSRGLYQFYNLEYLWDHIKITLENKIKVLNLATEPVAVSEIYREIKGTDFVNELTQAVPKYNFKTNYAKLFGGKNGYIFSKEFVLNDLKQFIASYYEYINADLLR